MYIMQERRVTATIEMLDDAMAKNPSLAEFLMTPIVKLPPRYANLVAASPSKIDPRLTLYDEALYCLKNYTASEFSMIGNKITGFMPYTATDLIPPRVLAIAVFSCDMNARNTVLLRDMLNFVKELQRKYTSVEWDTTKDNPANRIYQRLAQKEDGRFGDNINHPCFIRYRLPGTMPLSEKMHFSREYGVWYRYKKDLEEYVRNNIDKEE